MKERIIISAIFFLIFSVFAGPKELSRSGEVIPSKTNRLYIKAEDSLNTVFRKSGNILQMGGYSIKNSDQDLGFIKTSKKRIHSNIIGRKIEDTIYAYVLKKNNGSNMWNLLLGRRFKRFNMCLRTRRVCHSTLLG
jgi:hypothetical protein